VTSVTPVSPYRICQKTLINNPVTAVTGVTKTAINLDLSRLKSIKRLDRVLSGFCDNCSVENPDRKVNLTFRAETFDGGVLLLCEDCGQAALKALRERDGCAG